MNLLDSVLILLLVGAFILLIAVFFLIWFAKYNEKPSTFFLPAVLPAVCESAPQTLELEKRSLNLNNSESLNLFLRLKKNLSLRKVHLETLKRNYIT